MVNGLGGIFLKAKDPKYLSRWYEDHLGIDFGTTVYTTFAWKEKGSEKICHTDLSFMAEDTSYFFPSDSDSMINLRVDDLDMLRIQLKSDAQTVIDKVEVYDYGRFGWVIDPEGNKIELWEPPDQVPAEFGSGHPKKNVRGIGGFFLKSVNPSALSEWYSKYFGFFFNHSAHTFERTDPDTGKDQMTVFSLFPMETKYIQPSQKSFMLNFIVTDLEALVSELKSSEVEMVGDIQIYEYGKFAWFMDPEGNKVELWQPAE